MNSSQQHEWTNYEFQPSFILGFHGCDEAVGEAILQDKASHLNFSSNNYDWLGQGIYFWEGNPARALAFAMERLKGGINSQGNISKPFVLGAVINLGRCLDLADSSAIAEVRSNYHILEQTMRTGGVPLPGNGRELKARRLDCLVFNALHDARQKAGAPPFDSVRGLFWEGDEIYPNAGIREQNHIQICVRNRECILGYFRPIKT